jgi:anthranilate phosphoribosyltransferase
VKIGGPAEQVARSIREAGLGFMMAQTHHAAMRHVGPVRVEMGARTIFNILGPLSNPAGVRRQLTGAFAPSLLEPMAQVLANTGTVRAGLVHGSDGLDELTTTGPSEVVELDGGKLRRFSVTPEDAGLSRAEPAALKGADPAANARALREVLAGAQSAYRDIALLNAAGALVVAGRAANLAEGAAQAAAAIASGKAAKTLDTLVAVTSAEAPAR